MKYLALTAISTCLALGPGAMAQTANPSSNQKSKGSQTGSQGSIMGQQQVKSSLEKAGFKDVAVIDAAYVVLAQSSDGSMVSMTVDADIQSGQRTGSVAPTSPDKLRQSLEQSGFRNIRILDAAYLLHGKTPDGSMAFMTINPSSAGTGSTGQSGATSGGATQTPPAKTQ